MADSPTEKIRMVRLDLTPDVYRKLNILAAMRESGGIKPECEEAAKFWLEIHTDKDGNLTETMHLPKKHPPRVKEEPQEWDVTPKKGGSRE